MDRLEAYCWLMTLVTNAYFRVAVDQGPAYTPAEKQSVADLRNLRLALTDEQQSSFREEWHQRYYDDSPDTPLG